MASLRQIPVLVKILATDWAIVPCTLIVGFGGLVEIAKAEEGESNNFPRGKNRVFTRKEQLSLGTFKWKEQDRWGLENNLILIVNSLIPLKLDIVMSSN